MMFKSLKEIALDAIHGNVNHQESKSLACSGIYAISASLAESDLMDELGEIRDNIMPGDVMHKFLQFYFTESVRYYELTEIANPVPLHYVSITNSRDRYLVIFTGVDLLRDVVHVSWLAFYDPYLPKPRYENNPETIARVSEFLESTKRS